MTFEPFLDHFDTWEETLEYFIQPKFKLEKEIFRSRGEEEGDLYSHPKRGQIKVGDFFIVVGNIKGALNIAYKYMEPTPTDINENNHWVVYTSSDYYTSLLNKPPSIYELFNYHLVDVLEDYDKDFVWWKVNRHKITSGSNTHWNKDAEFYIMDYTKLNNSFLNWPNRNPIKGGNKS